MIEVTPLSGNLAGEPVMVVIPRAGRVRIDHDAEGVRWLTVRRWWGRTYIHWPLAAEGADANPAAAEQQREM